MNVTDAIMLLHSRKLSAGMLDNGESTVSPEAIALLTIGTDINAEDLVLSGRDFTHAVLATLPSGGLSIDFLLSSMWCDGFIAGALYQLNKDEQTDE